MIALAALGKALLKGKAKKIAKDKLLNRKKKKTKKKTSGKEMSDGIMNNEKSKKGGALIVRPTTDLVGNIKDFDPVSDTSGESDIVIIRKQVIQVRDILKDSYTAKKEEREEERKARQVEKREKREEELEKSKVKPKESKGKMPNIKLGIGNFLSWLVFGLVVNKLLELMPQLKKIWSWLKPIINFIGGIFKATIGFVVGFIDLSYAGVEKLEKAMEAIGGEGGKKLFERFGNLFTTLMNGALIAALAAIRVGNFGRRGRLPKGQKPPKSSRRKGIERWFKKTPVGKLVRNQKAKILRGVRRFSRTGVGKTLKALRPRNVGKFIMEGGVDKALKSGVKNVLKFDPRKSLKNLQKTEAAQKVTEIAKKLDPRKIKFKMPQIKTPGWMKSAGSAIQKRFTSSVDWVKSLPAKSQQLFDTIGKKLGPMMDEVGDGISKIGKNMGKKLNDLKKLKPQAAIDNLTNKLKPVIDDILKKNPIINQIAKNLNPKNARKSIQGLLTKAANNPALKKLINTLKSNKGASKGLGPIDKIITALMSLVDYAIFKESPINAILKGLGGLFGYAAGFSAASAVPVLGQSGVFNFMGGMAGGIAGEWLAMKTAKVLAAGPLGKLDDPIMGPKDIEEGRPARKLVRDPDGLMDHMIEGASVKLQGDDIQPGDTQNKAEGLDTDTSYSQSGMAVVDNTTTYIQPIEV